MSKAERQRRWREQKDGGATVYLDDHTLAILEAIAEKLRDADPHLPEQNQPCDYAGMGRSPAIRHLAQEWLKEHPEAEARVQQIQSVPLSQRSEYWRDLTGYRRKGIGIGDEAPTPPMPPWR